MKLLFKICAAIVLIALTARIVRIAGSRSYPCEATWEVYR